MSSPLDEEYEQLRWKCLDAIERRLLELGMTPEQWQQASRQFLYECFWGEPPPCDLPENWGHE